MLDELIVLQMWQVRPCSTTAVQYQWGRAAHGRCEVALMALSSACGFCRVECIQCLYDEDGYMTHLFTGMLGGQVLSWALDLEQNLEVYRCALTLHLMVTLSDASKCHWWSMDDFGPKQSPACRSVVRGSPPTKYFCQCGSTRSPRDARLCGWRGCFSFSHASKPHTKVGT